MTYETALDWALDHVDMNEYDSFNDWYEEVQDALQTPALDNNEFYDMAERAWNRDIDIEESEYIEEPVSGVREIPIEQGRDESVSIDRQFTITPEGIKPVESVHVELPREQIKTDVIINQQMSTAQKISIAQRVKMAFATDRIKSVFGGLFRRKK